MYRYVLYARKSAEERKLTEKSIREQVSHWREQAPAQGLLIAFSFEESKSAMKPHQRPLFAEMLELLQDGKADAILCWHINRLVRNMEEGGLLAQWLIDGKVKEIRTPFALYRQGDNILPLVLEAATSTQYSLDLQHTVCRGMEGHVDHGGWNSKAYQGYRNTRDPNYPKVGVVVPDEERFPLIRKGWELMLTGAYTPAQVWRVLNEEYGYRTRKTEKAGGTPLSRACVYELFSNPFYAGYVMYKGHLRRGNHQPMVSEEEFVRVQEILSRTTRQNVRRHTFTYTGFLRCGYCGLQITAEHHTVSGRPWVFYRCSNAHGRCTTKGLAEASVQAEVLKVLEGLSLNREVCALAHQCILRALSGEEPDREAVQQQQERTLADLDKQLENLVSMWLRGLLTDEKRYKQLEQSLEEERASLLLNAAQERQQAEQIGANADRAFGFLQHARQEFLLAEPARKREIALALCSEARMFGADRRLVLTPYPLLVELAHFARTLPKHAALPVPEPAGGFQVRNVAVGRVFEPKESGSGSLIVSHSKAAVLGGRAGQTEIEVPESLLSLLRDTTFPELGFALTG